MTNSNERIISASKAVVPAAAQFIAEKLAPGTGPLVDLVSTLAIESLDLIRQRLKDREEPLRHELETALNIIQKRAGKKPEDLFADQAYVTFAVEALRIGVRKHQRETLVRLRVALISGALSSNQDHDLHMQYLRLLDELSERHILLLDALCSKVNDKIGFFDYANPIENAEATLYETHVTSLQFFYSSLSDDCRAEISRFHFRLITSDLCRYFLIHLGDAEDLEEFQSGQSGLITEQSVSKPIFVTKHGIDFLRFVRADNED